jgi:hypothetical protein
MQRTILTAFALAASAIVAGHGPARATAAGGIAHVAASSPHSAVADAGASPAATNDAKHDAPARSARWGEHGHRMIGQAAAEALPAAMPAFFRVAAEQLAYLNPEPDRWRGRDERALDPAMDNAHASEHYINLERVPAGALNAPHRFAFQDSLRAAGIEIPGPGLLPWRILELTQRLRVEFRLWRAATDAQERAWIEQRIINDAGILGHYVADASNPHHTTIQHNGWVGENPRGFTTDNTFHSRFESVFVRERVTLGHVRAATTAPAAVRAPLRPAIFEYVAASHALVESLYELEQREPFGPATASADHHRFAVSRLAAGAEMLRDLWWTAWMTSGQ